MHNEPTLTIEVHGRAVSTNARLGENRRTGRKYLTKAAREWKENVALEAIVAEADRMMMATPLYRKMRLPLQIVLHVHGTRLDADNAAKLILDGLAEGIDIDDRHFKPITVHTYGAPMKTPYTLIHVYEAEASEAA